MKYSDFLKHLDECPFCGDSREKIFENNNAFLTYSIAPYHKDHLLVVPKRHIEHILELRDEEIKDIDALQKIGLKILGKLGYCNMCMLVREGTGEKSVAHTHYHIIPDLVLGDVDHTGNDRRVMTESEITAQVSRINFALRE